MRGSSVMNHSYVFCLKDGNHFRRCGGGGEVNVPRAASHQQIAHSSARDAQLVIITTENGGQMLKLGREKRTEIGIVGVNEALQNGRYDGR